MSSTEILILILALLSILSYAAGRLDERRRAEDEINSYKDKIAKLISIINQMQIKTDAAKSQCDHILEYLNSKGEIKQ